jgi:hypothetical protein
MAKAFRIECDGFSKVCSTAEEVKREAEFWRKERPGYKIYIKEIKAYICRNGHYTEEKECWRCGKEKKQRR